MVRLLRQALQLDTRAGAAWPGFRLRDQVLALVAQPAGPVALAGDSVPPRDYQVVDAEFHISLRHGVPPDSLSGFRVPLAWRGELRKGTAISYRSGESGWMLHTLVHEAFHTFQHRVAERHEGSFPGGPTQVFPDTLIEAIGLLNLESHYLAQALRAPSPREATALARTALAVRTRRCALLGRDECQAERLTEQTEGTAVYVAAFVLDDGASSRKLDSLQRALGPIQQVRQLQRVHFYDSGHAWLILLDRLGPKDWKSRVEHSAPDLVLAEAIRFTPAVADSIVAAGFDSTAVATAGEQARHLVASEVRLRDSVQSAFWAQPGVPVRIYWPTMGSMNSERSADSGAVIQNFIIQLPDGTQRTYGVGAREETMRFGDGPDRLTIRGLAVTETTPSWVWVSIVVTIVRGHVALVDGHPVPLDRPGTDILGALELNLANVSLVSRRAQLKVFSDSIAVRMQ